MNIPKLAKGGIPQNQTLFIANERIKPVVDISGKKYFNIYNRTKNRRIKKKQLNKCPMLNMRIELERYIKENIILTKNFSKDINVYINNKNIMTIK